MRGGVDYNGKSYKRVTNSRAWQIEGLHIAWT
jgi:hypothetical protein